MATSTQSSSVSQMAQPQALVSGSQQPQQLVIIVEATAALGPSWPTLRSEYIDKITRAFCSQDGNSQSTTSNTNNTVNNVEMGLVVFGSHGMYTGFKVQRSGWTSNLELFHQWLSSIDFFGGGFDEVATAEGLVEALMMFSSATTQPMQRQSVLVGASNPRKIPTAVLHPVAHTWHLADAETIAKLFPQCNVSLSVVCPRQLPSLKNLYVVAKRNSKWVDNPTEYAKSSQHMILISETFSEARAGLRRPSPPPAVTAVSAPVTAPVTTVSSQLPAQLPSQLPQISSAAVKLEQQTAVSSVPAVTVPQMISTTATSNVAAGPPVAPVRQPQVMSNGNIPTSTVKIEQNTATTTASLPYGSPPMLNNTSAALPLPMQSSSSSSVSALTQDVLRSSIPEVTSNPLQTSVPANLQTHRPVAAANVLNAFSRHSSALNLGAGSATPMSNILSSGLSTAGQGGLGIPQSVSHGNEIPATSLGGPVTSGIQQNIPTPGQNMPGSIPQNIQNTIPQNLPNNIPSSLPASVPSIGHGTSSLVGQVLTQQGISQMPQQGISQMPQQGISQLPQQGISQMPQQGISQMPQQGISQMPQQGISQMPQQGISQMPQQGISQMPQQGISQMPQQGVSQISQQGISQIPQQGISQIPQQGVPQIPQGISQMPQQTGMGIPNQVSNANMPGMMPGQTPSAGSVATPPQPAGNNAKYTKLWTGTLAGQRQGKPVPICKLEGYRQISAPESLAADWPQTMQIIRLIPQDYMNREYHGKAELLVFKPLTQHGFLMQLAAKKLCAVIQLPSQTLLLASHDKPQRMIGMLFPGDMVVFKPQASSTQQGGAGFTHGGFQQGASKPQLMPMSGTGQMGFLS